MIDNELVELCIKSLKNAFKVHNELGDKGFEAVQKNVHGDTSLVADINAEEAIIETFRNAGVPIKIIFEERDTVDLSSSPKFLAVLDGLDGTSVYKESKGKGRYGTMFAVFSNTNPDYADYLFCGVMEHSTNHLFYAVKNKGCFLIKDNVKIHIKCSNVRKLEDASIYADEFFDGKRNTTLIHDIFISKLQEYKFLHSNSSAVHYVDLAHGKADLVLECTRKGNLEIAVAFGLENEAGGVMVTLDGVSIANQKYLTFAQDEYVPIISASTIELATDLIRKIK